MVLHHAQTAGYVLNFSLLCEVDRSGVWQNSIPLWKTSNILIVVKFNEYQLPAYLKVDNNRSYCFEKDK